MLSKHVCKTCLGAVNYSFAVVVNIDRKCCIGLRYPFHEDTDIAKDPPPWCLRRFEHAIAETMDHAK